MKTKLFAVTILMALSLAGTAFGSARPSGAETPAAPVIEERFRARHKLNRYVLEKSSDPQAFDSSYVTCPFVVRADGRFYMTYVGHDGVGYQTGLATSEDLVNWTKLGLIIRRDPASPVLRYSIALTSILRDNSLGSEGAPKKVNGRYLGSWMAFPEQGHEAGPAVIGLAWSDDLRSWELTDPVLRPEDGEAWERGGLYKSYLMENDGVYYLFYNAKNNTRAPWREQIGLATSTDLVHWRRAPNNPIIPNGPAGARDEVFAADPVVLRSGSVWALYYYGLSKDRHARDLVAFSTDLQQFKKGDGVLIDVGAKGAIDDRHAHKPSVITWQGDLYHFYDAVSNNGGPHPTNAVRGISVARSRPW